MTKWRYARYGFLVLFATTLVMAIVALIMNPVLFIGLLMGAGFSIFMIYGVLSNWEDDFAEKGGDKK